MRADALCAVCTICWRTPTTFRRSFFASGSTPNVKWTSSGGCRSACTGVSILCQCQALQADVHLHSDASGSWGCGTHWKRGFSSRWRGTSYFRSWWPVCCGVICGGDQRCVPTATTLPWWRKSPEARPREPLLCHQLRALFFTSAHFDFELIAQHNPGRDNSLADALSRDDLHSFFVQVPSADHAPTPVPVALQVRLSKAQPFWKSPDWRDWYSHALALSTPRTYASAQTRYLHFCSSINIPALPVNEQCLYQFVVLLATQRVAHASLKGYQSALRHLLILSLGADPNISDMVVLHYFLQGIRPPLGLGRPVFAFPLQSTS